ncbi:MAG: hypothetical protein V2I97_24155, partial [Desulfococcaceae bacterium]|nr:hypothetical protein [Desulfococcaceae bacterium]
MFIEACIISLGLHLGSELHKRIRNRTNRTGNRSDTDNKGLRETFSTLDAACQKFVRERIDPLFGDTRGQQLRALSPTGNLPEISREEKKTNRLMLLAFGNIFLAGVCELFHPSLIFITAPLILLFSVDYFRDAFRSLFIDRRIRISVMDSIMVIWILMSGYYFPGSLAIFAISLHRKLLMKTKEGSRKKVIDVFARHPASVWILADGTEVEIPFEQLQSGDVVAVNAGEMIPADGEITEGMASVDQHILTGESAPVEKGIGEKVLAGTFVLSGKIRVFAEKAGQETVSAKIGEILNRTTD